MRRIFATIGFSSFFICLFCIYFGFEFSVIISILALVALIAVVCIKPLRNGAVIIVLASIVLFSLNTVRFESTVEKYNEIYCKSEKSISGILLDYPESSKSGFNYIFRTDDENKVKFSLFCYDELDIEPGDRIEGVFDFSDKYASLEDRVYFSAYVYRNETVKITENDSFNIAKLRKSLKSGITDNMTFGRGITTAITFGDLSGISDEVYTSLQRCGLLHATATSGLHLTIVTGFLFTLLSFFGVSKKKSSLIVIAFVIMFMTVIGFRFSLVRAGIMMIMVLSANLFDRDSDAFNSIGLVLSILTLINPYTVYSCSLLLSVCATIGIVFTLNWFSPIVERNFKSDSGIVKRTLASFGVGIIQSACATLFTLPVVYIYFGYFSVAGIFVNAVLSPFITVVLVLGVLICLLQFLPIVPYLLGAVNDVFSLVILKVSEFVSKSDYCLISVNYDYLAITIFAYFTVIALGFLIYTVKSIDKNRIIKITSLICVNILLLSVLLNTVIPYNKITLSVSNSGGAVNICIVEKDKTFVIDCGGSRCDKSSDYILNKYAEDKIDNLIIPYATEDGFSSAVLMTKNITTDNTYINTRLLDKSIYGINSRTENIEKIREINYNRLKIRLITVSRFTVVYISNGETSALLVDGTVDCNYIPSEYRDCDLLIVNNSLPSNTDCIKSEKAVIFSYEEESVKECAKRFKTYSLENGNLEVILNKELKLRQV